MKKYSAALVVVAIVLAVMLIVLVSAFKPINSLIRPPKVEGKNLDIQTAFEEYTGANYLLKQPISGNYRSAYTFIDLDGDNDDEVIVFYSTRKEIDIVRMNVLDEINGQWKSIADFASQHNQIMEIEFADLDGDSLKEIIVGWTTYKDDYSKLMSVYKIAEDAHGVSIKSVFDDSYSQFRVMDIDCDGTSDILNLKYATTGNSAEYSASFLAYSVDGISERGSTFLDRSISSVTAVSSDYDKTAKRRRIYIDGYKVDSGMATDCFSWNDSENNFQRYSIDNMTISALSSRTCSVNCSDIDSDGIIEVPFEEFLPGSAVINMEKSLNQAQSLIKWVKLTDSAAITTEYRIINSSLGYSLIFDKSWIGTFTVKNDIESGILTFYLLEDIDGELKMTQSCFAIKTVPKDDEQSYFTTNYDYLFTSETGSSFYLRIFAAGEDLGITNKIIKKSIVSG